ncbi:MAG: histidine kinase [Clostridia bacterium]|nr:histidine kinase [Clostridia bacterium]
MSRRLRHITIALIIIFGVLSAGVVLRSFAIDMDAVHLNMTHLTPYQDGWQRVVSGTYGSPDCVLEPVDAKHPHDYKAYEKMVLVNEMPNLLYGTESSMIFLSIQQKVQVFVGEKLIYSYGNFDDDRFIETVPTAWNVFRLPLASSNEPLIVELISAYDLYADGIPEFYVGPYQHCVGFVTGARSQDVFMSFILIVLGILIILLGASVHSLGDSNNSLLYWGIFTLLVGIWALCECQVDQFLIDNIYLAWTVKFSALFLMPVPLLLYARSRAALGLCKKVINVAIPVVALINAGVMLCQLLGIADLLELITVSHITLGIAGFMFTMVIIRALGTTHRNAYKVSLVCIIILLICFAAAMYFYYHSEYLLLSRSVRLTVCIVSMIYTFETLHEVWGKARDAAHIEQEILNQQKNRLISQIHPHFMYNTLSAVRVLIVREPEKASDLVYRFSKYLRMNLDSLQSSEPVPFSKELDHIKNYLAIEKVRFDDKLNVTYDIQVEDFSVPPLSIQPLVENAVKHGICQKEEGGTVTVASREAASEIVVEIIDDGAGYDANLGKNFCESSNPAVTVGFESVRSRLDIIAGASLEVKSTPGKGTRATVRFPKQ